MYFRHQFGADNTLFRDAAFVREQVFIKEQQISPEIELDEADSSTTHIVGYLDNQPVAVARLSRVNAKIVKAQRVAVLKEYRGQGIASKLMQYFEATAKEAGYDTVILGAQSQAIPFYESLGYKIVSSEFFEAGISHYQMEKGLSGIK